MHENAPRRGVVCEVVVYVGVGVEVLDLQRAPPGVVAEQVPEGQEVAGAMQELGDFFESLREAFAKSGGLDLMDSQQEMFAYMKELNGYPVRARDYSAAGELVKETKLIGASNEEVDPQMFEPPPTYQRKELQ